MICTEALILAGFMYTVPIPHAKTATDSEVVEIMTCDQGPGINVKLAPTAGLYGAQLQYGYAAGPFRFIPQVGIVGDTHGYRELPMGVQFMVGGEVMIGYDGLWLSIGYDHISNAGLHDTLRKPNSGLDLFTGKIGFTFN